MKSNSDTDTFLGQIIAGRYKVHTKLGQGGMGAIYTATQEPLGRQVALKVLLRAYAQDATAVARFEKEARAISKLVHPNIVTIFDFGQTSSGDFFIAMELLSGKSLRESLDLCGRMDWRQALHIVQGITVGLAEAHRRSIIHRDLKPENVMLVRSGEDHQFAKILDFGLARTSEPGDSDVQLTQKDMIPGTPSYISPERINGIGNDPRSDLYSLGALWFELLAGRPPFFGATPVKVIVAHVQEPVPSFHSILPPVTVPEEIEIVIRKLLAKDPEDRPQSASQLLRILQNLVAPENWSAISPGELGLHRHDGLRDWAEEIGEEIPNINFAGFLGFDDEDNEESNFSGIESDFSEVSLETEPVDHTDTFVLLTDPKENLPLELESRISPPGSSSPYWNIQEESLIPPPSLQDTATRIEKASSVEEIASSLTDHLGNFFDRSFVLDTRDMQKLRIISSRGVRHIHNVQDVFQACAGFWGLVFEGSPFYGPAIDTPDWTRLQHHISASKPNAIFVASLQKNSANWGVLYAEHGAPNLHENLSDVAHVLDLATYRLQEI